MPELLFVRLCVQKARHAMNLLQRRHPLEKIAENVQRGVTEIIGRMQAWKREAVDLPSDSAIPELIEAIHAKPHEIFIPEAEMKFESDWHLGIEDVQAGRPCDVWHHRGQLII